MEAKKGRGGARPGSGRKRLRPEERTVQITLKLTEVQKAKLMRLGSSRWMRERVDEAEDPTE